MIEGEGEFEAAIFDLGIFASGDTEEEAIANLKETLLDTFDQLNELPDTRLGKGPLRQKGLLNKCVRKVEKGVILVYSGGRRGHRRQARLHTL